MGLSLARALSRSGTAVTLLGRTGRNTPPEVGAVQTSWSADALRAPLIIVAVPDDCLAEVAARAAAVGAGGAERVVLHTSGLHGSSLLRPLAETGAAVGSWHPVQTFADRGGEPDAFAGAPVVIEGDVSAVAAGRELARRLEMAPVVEITAAGKAKYHAAAVFASNYLVVVGRVAARVAADAGLGAESDRIFVPLMRRAVQHLAADPATALTGPIARGDAATVSAHLAALDPADRALYAALGREALRIAADAGLAPALCEAIGAALGR